MMHEGKGHKEDQAHRIMEERRDIMRAKNPERTMVNAGAPSHGVTEGPDGKDAMPVRKVDACGKGYKGYDEMAWKY
jgi:hypothetical protein